MKALVNDEVTAFVKEEFVTKETMKSLEQNVVQKVKQA